MLTGNLLQLTVDIANYQPSVEETQVTVKVTDNADEVSQRLSSSTVVQILFVSPVLHSVQFTQPTYQWSVDENSASDVVIGTVRVQIIDGAGGEVQSQYIEYRIKSVEPEIMADKLKVNLESGQVTTTAKIIDYEAVSTITVTIEASENTTAMETLRADVQIVITVEDLNDNEPRFIGSNEVYVDADGKVLPSIGVLIDENKIAGDLILTLSDFVQDQDKSFEPNWAFQMLSGSHFFELSESNLILSKNVTCEQILTETNNRIQIRVVDENVSTLYSDGVVDVFFVDLNNKFPPQFQTQRYTWPVAESSKPVKEIGIVKATDSDCGYETTYASQLQQYYTSYLDHSLIAPQYHVINSIRYYLVESAESRNISLLDFFEVEPRIGQVYLIKSVNYETNSIFDGRMLAVDFVTPKRISIVPIKIPVIDENEPPEFENSLYEESVFETDSMGDEILSVAALDLDASESFANFRYELQSNVSLVLNIDHNTGVISNRVPLDREILGNLLEFAVFAVDSQDPDIRTSTDVEITILDINDNAPLLGGIYEINRDLKIDENQPAKSVIATFDLIYDLDTAENGAPFIIEINNLEVSNLVEIVGNELRSKDSFDHEQVENFEVIIGITDNGTPEQTSLFTFNVHIEDLNDNPPFSKSWTVNIVSHSFIPNLEIEFVYPEDSDSTSNEFSCSNVEASSEISVVGLDSTCRFSVFETFVDSTALTQYTVNDGVHVDVLGSALVSSFVFGDEITVKASSFFMRIESLTIEDFIELGMAELIKNVRNLVMVDVNVVSIWNVQRPEASVLVMLAAKSISEDDFKRVQDLMSQISHLTGLKISNVSKSACEALEVYCSNGQTSSCSENIEIGNVENRQTFSSNSVILNTLDVTLSLKCGIEDVLNYCIDNEKNSVLVCLNGGFCLRSTENDHFTCQCLEGFSGKSCEFSNGVETRPCQRNDNSGDQLCTGTSDGSFCINKEQDEMQLECVCQFPYQGKNCGSNCNQWFTS